MNRNSNLDKALLPEILRYEEMLCEGTQLFFDKDDLLEISEYYFYDDETAKALQCLEYALQLYPADDDVLAQKALFYLLDDPDITKAQNILALAADRENRNVCLVQGELYFYEGKDRKAKAYFKKMFADLEADEVDCFFEIARIFYFHQHFKEAIDWVGKGKTANREWLYQRDKFEADCLLQLGRTKQAKKRLEALLNNRHVFDATLWALLADAQFSEGEVEKVIESCDYALALDEKNEDVQRTKGFALVELNEHDKAKDCFLKYIERNRDDGSVWMMLGVCFLELDNLEKGAVYLETARAIFQEDAASSSFGKECLITATSLLARQKAKSKQLEEALKEVRKARRLGHDELDNLFLRLQVFLDGEDQAKAREEMEKYFFRKSTTLRKKFDFASRIGLEGSQILHEMFLQIIEPMDYYNKWTYIAVAGAAAELPQKEQN